MKWINVKDKMPKELTNVLIIHDGTMINPEKNKVFEPVVGIGQYIVEHSSRKRKYWAVSSNAGDYWGCLFEDSKSVWGWVTYWKPLPKPPKEVDDVTGSY